ncbi:MAG TPA: hypothetical protein V6D20_07730, partial [Candidatus Obscuribacterales bacterium]
MDGWLPECAIDLLEQQPGSQCVGAQSECAANGSNNKFLKDEVQILSLERKHKKRCPIITLFGEWANGQMG